MDLPFPNSGATRAWSEFLFIFLETLASISHWQCLKFAALLTNPNNAMPKPSNESFATWKEWLTWEPSSVWWECLSWTTIVMITSLVSMDQSLKKALTLPAVELDTLFSWADALWHGKLIWSPKQCPALCMQNMYLSVFRCACRLFLSGCWKKLQKPSNSQPRSPRPSIAEPLRTTKVLCYWPTTIVFRTAHASTTSSTIGFGS